ncbi:MAG: SDR family NAD(P)-dependent oxidoreductase [Thermoleophilaceae bacterium]|jgi:NAD(P)-dependent dehydrogenase (short-subunit alcohol dehydrogenase family)|nr:SDR family NAD(P)-dependent oxidoreductase [Thermoleophilaceae bacterium]
MASTALILGARNLGSAIAEHLAVAGWNIAAVARSDETVERVLERLPDALAVAADAADPDQLAAVAEQARERFGSLELVVNAVSPGARAGGPFGGGPLVEASREDFDHYMAGVARQVFTFLGVGARALRAEGGGTLVQITGGSSRRAIAGRGPWAAGAFATRALTQSAALELRDEGIHAVLLIVDATIHSPKTGSGEGAHERTEMQDVAAAVGYLAAQPPTAWTHELQVTASGDRWVP